ncbi:hypothetical protein COCSADRAFT_243418 [Bipolaris sorokiniana ND90Pr]|uniref:Uncharacterized protein n=1 Tax=Cochliobolus sativus (strain ND90Pr / ATCC 201652) TaxID=665912 RepID=M2QZI8_COCSN|nr:uncharacterized protein COCSADRAFT_243418 [Bipolaris sorokiniana ND90Pr]EMD60484.1 hypothetical protein COCSADRAFT_243418 [Bipolaris sorokiniana ND90Pr]
MSALPSTLVGLPPILLSSFLKGHVSVVYTHFVMCDLLPLFTLHYLSCFWHLASIRRSANVKDVRLEFIASSESIYGSSNRCFVVSMPLDSSFAAMLAAAAAMRLVRDLSQSLKVWPRDATAARS